MIKVEVDSPNQWITRAGGHVSEEGNCVLPMKDILVPMHNASTSLVQYEAEKDESQTMDRVGKMQLIQGIAYNVRAADKAYFGLWSKTLIEINIKLPATVELFGGCKNCLQSSFSQNALREHVSPELKLLSDLNNENIIHKLDSGGIIQEQDYEIAIRYYNEFLNLNLMFYPEVKSLKKKVCRECSS